jgi:coenzyme F420-reducing hydrogenase beta subunit
MPKLMLKIDDQQIEADDSKTLLQAARDAGIFIPTLCHHPALEPFGSCRLCSVEIEKNGRKKIVTSCNYPAEGGLIVRTSSQDVVSIRALIIELLLARCPEETIIKSLAVDYGIAEPRFKLAGESCIMCGLCARVCEEMVGVSAISAISRGIERAVDAPYRDLSEDCIACGSCALICPTSAIKGMKNVYPLTSQDARAIERSFLQGEYDEEIGFHSDIFACRTLVQGQDGGVVTSMLAAALEKGVIDAAIVVLQGNEYRADATVAENVKTIIDSSGTKYVRVPVISQLREALKSGKRRLAVVGTPCQIRVIRKSQLDGYLGREFPEAEIILIGLFCFESFDHIDLRRHIRDLFTIDIEKAERVQIAKGKFSVRMGDEKYSCNVKDLESDVREGCRFCSDFVSRLADLSIGSVGSADGCSTVIIRSDRGRRLLREATYSREAVNKDEIAKLSAIKRKRAEKQSERILEGLAWQNHSPVSVSIK